MPHIDGIRNVIHVVSGNGSSCLSVSPLCFCTSVSVKLIDMLTNCPSVHGMIAAY